MLRRLAFMLLISVLALTACTQVPATGNASPLPTQGPAQGDTPQSNTSPVIVPTVSWQPAPGDEKLQRGKVDITLSDILTLESFPPQFLLHLAGEKGNPCTLVRVKVSPPDAQNRIQVDAYTLIDPAEICIQRLDYFDINVPLGSFPKGEYTVWLNGSQIGQITAP